MDNDALTYTVRDGRVTLDISLDDFNLFMLALGYACGAAIKNNEPEFNRAFTRLVVKLYNRKLTV